jgi:hypothetical protein
MLARWIRAEHLDTRRAAADAAARPFARYVVLDELFTHDALARIEAEFREASFNPDNLGTNYDSLGSAIPQDCELGRLLRDDAWLDFVHDALGLSKAVVEKNVTALRMHTPQARGFWPHCDDLPSDPKRIAVLVYLTQTWRPSDGGVLQLWTEAAAEVDVRPPLRWDDWRDRRLTFLEDSNALRLELGGPSARPVVSLRLVDAIAPLYNRALLMALRPVPAIHSVTPSNWRERRAILQWLT